MLQSRYQRVGVLAGLVMFFGAWLSAYYNHWFWPALTVVVVLVAIWGALQGETEEEVGKRSLRGFLVGAIIAVIARLLGMLTMVWAFDSWSSSVTATYSGLSDVFKVVFNGGFWASILMILGSGIVGAFIAYAMPYFTTEREE